MRIFALLAWVLLFCQAVYADAGSNNKYVFYLHGAIIEKGDPKPVHPQFGLYDYPAIVSTLSGFDFHLISEQRGNNTDYQTYARKVSGQINELIAKGVKARDITVIGFSKGGVIAVMTSSLLKNDEINFAIMAACSEWYDKEEALQTLRLRGHILSIYEKSDHLGSSCKKLAQRSPGPASFTEVAINTGKSHGAFFLPASEWVNPVIAWIHRKTDNNSTLKEEYHGDP